MLDMLRIRLNYKTIQSAIAFVCFLILGLCKFNITERSLETYLFVALNQIITTLIVCVEFLKFDKILISSKLSQIFTMIIIS